MGTQLSATLQYFLEIIILISLNKTDFIQTVLYVYKKQKLHSLDHSSPSSFAALIQIFLLVFIFSYSVGKFCPFRSFFRYVSLFI